MAYIFFIACVVITSAGLILFACAMAGRDNVIIFSKIDIDEGD